MGCMWQLENIQTDYEVRLLHSPQRNIAQKVMIILRLSLIVQCWQAIDIQLHAIQIEATTTHWSSDHIVIP